MCYFSSPSSPKRRRLLRQLGAKATLFRKGVILLIRKLALKLAALAFVLSLVAVPAGATWLINTDDIADGAVTSPKIRDYTIQRRDLASGSVNSPKILDGTIANTDIAGNAAIAASKIAGTAWTALNDGPSSGLDADLLDGQDASDFASSGHYHDQSTVTVANLPLDSNGAVRVVDERSNWKVVRLFDNLPVVGGNSYTVTIPVAGFSSAYSLIKASVAGSYAHYFTTSPDGYPNGPSVKSHWGLFDSSGAWIDLVNMTDSPPIRGPYMTVWIRPDSGGNITMDAYLVR